MEDYPASLEIDYSDKSNRLTAFFRIILVIPIWIILSLLASDFVDTSNGEVMEHYHYVGIVFLPTLLMILFRQKYPKWWFDWNVALTKFSARVASYILLLRDEYPSTDEEQSVHIDIPYPNAEKELNRWMPLVKWLLAIPHVIVLIILFAIVVLFTIFAWLIIVLTGNYPKSMFDFVVGFLRWTLRVYAYAVLLTTDEYPPFSLS